MIDRILKLIKSIFPQDCSPAEERSVQLLRPEIANAKLEIARIVEAEKSRLRAEELAKSGRKVEEVDFDTKFFSPEFDSEIRTFLLKQAERAECFGTSVQNLVRLKCEGGASECYRRAGVGRQTFSKIVKRKDNIVSKRIAMQLCVGLRLSVDESEELLAKAGYAFSKSLIEDMAFRWCLEHSVYNILDVNAILVSLHCNPLKLTF